MAGEPGVRAAGFERHRQRIVDPIDRHRDDAAARHRRHGDHVEVEDQLDLVLRQQGAGGVPHQGGALVVEQAPGDQFRVTGVDQGAGRTGGAEGEAAELQAGRGAARAFLDEVEREAAHVLVLLVLQNFEAVDDRADGADHVMADARAQKGGEIERIERKSRHRLIHSCCSGRGLCTAKRRLVNAKFTTRIRDTPDPSLIARVRASGKSPLGK